MDKGFLARLASLQAEKAELAAKLPEADVGHDATWEREVYAAAPITAVSDDDFIFPLSELAGSGEPAFELRIHENHTTIGGRVWDGGIFLARNLQKAAAEGRIAFDGRVVLELGAGTGIVGLVALSLGAKAVLMTDIAAVLPSLNNNVEANVDTCLRAAGVERVSGGRAFHCLGSASTVSCDSQAAHPSSAAASTSSETIPARCCAFTAVLEWGVTPVSQVLHAAGISSIDVIIASDLAAPVKVVSQLMLTLREAFALGSESVQLWISCQTHREFTPALVAALTVEFSVQRLPVDLLHPGYVSPSSRQVLCIVRPKPWPSLL